MRRENEHLKVIIMKIPKYIDDALKKRTKAAEMFNQYDWIISDWIDKHGLSDDIDTADFHGGVESVINPEVSEANIRLAILAKGE